MTALAMKQQPVVAGAARSIGSGKGKRATERFEQFLVGVLIGGLALEESLPRIGPVSVGFILFAIVGVYVFFRRPGSFRSVLGMPLPLAFGVLVLIGLISEVSRYDPMFHYPRRIGLMALGMIVVATLVRSRAAIRASLLAFLFVASVQAAIVGLSSGETLYSTAASDYFTATSARIAAFKDIPIQGNFNRLAFIIGIGGVLGLVVAGTLQSFRSRLLVRTLSMLCFFGVAFLASRSAILATLASATALVVLRQKKRGRSALIAACLLAVLWFAMPGVSRARLSFGEVSATGREDGRTQVYRKTLSNIPEVLPFGVGEARYWNEWAFDVLQHRLGTHSAPLQFIVTWGFPGILALLLVVAGVIRSLPRIRVDDPLRFGMWAIAVGVLVRWLASHTVYDKEFSVLLGIIVGAQALVWPGSQKSRRVVARQVSATGQWSRPRAMAFPRGTRTTPRRVAVGQSASIPK